ncbi:MAG: hypothetical protein ACFE9C_18330 [Candidatus Hodarchaeota archaeon]
MSEKSNGNLKSIQNALLQGGAGLNLGEYRDNSFLITNLSRILRQTYLAASRTVRLPKTPSLLQMNSPPGYLLSRIRHVQEFIMLLTKNNVKYVIVGGEAVIYYSYARLTGDLDFFFGTSKENAQRLCNVLCA